MLQPRSHAHFAFEIVEHVLIDNRRVRDFQCNADALNRIHRRVDVGEATGPQTPLNAVFAKPLPGPQSGSIL